MEKTAKHILKKAMADEQFQSCYRYNEKDFIQVVQFLAKMVHEAAPHVGVDNREWMDKYTDLIK